VVFADIMDSIVDRLPHRRELSKGIEYGEPRVKLGLRGFVNGIETAAKGDTGSAVNVVSLAFAEKMKLEIEPGQQLFRLGNKNHVKSVGKNGQICRSISLANYSMNRSNFPQLGFWRRTK
jgi:hypothetical protein